MFVFIAIHLLYSRSARAMPAGIAPRADTTDHPWVLAQQYRTIWQIIYNCLATFVLCTWSAMHPNIPPRTDGKLRRYGRRLRLFLSLLFLPETIVIWATLQFLGARRLAKTSEFEERGWKLPHGFFAQMGGFVLHDADGNPLHVVWSKDVCAMLRSPLIESPRLTEEELEDRSKSDIITKFFAVFQTIFFFAQCIMRLKKRLPITELEVITFTYTMVNVYIYIVFWKKPQNVNYAFPVYEKNVSNGGRRRKREFSLVSQDEGYGIGWIWRLVRYLKLAGAAPFYGVNAWAINQDDKGIEAMAVPDLYYHGQKRVSSATILACTAFVGAAFGASHLIAWDVTVGLGYPSFAEEIAWRVSCIALTAIPPILLVCVLIATFCEDNVPRILVKITGSLAGPLMIILYIPVRFALLGLPFAALRKLPPDMYNSTFVPVPHVS